MNKSSCPNIVHDRRVHDFGAVHDHISKSTFGSSKFRVKSIVNFHFILVDLFS